METLALTKKRELAEREKELLKTKKLADEMAKEAARGQGPQTWRRPRLLLPKLQAKKKAPARKAPARRARDDHDAQRRRFRWSDGSELDARESSQQGRH